MGPLGASRRRGQIARIHDSGRLSASGGKTGAREIGAKGKFKRALKSVVS